MRFRSFSLLIAAFCVSSAAFAQAYLGVSAGQSYTKLSDPVFDRLAADPNIDLDIKKRDFAFKVFGGYDFNPYFALEGGYADLGKLQVDLFNRAQDMNLHGELKKSAWFLAAKGSYPIHEQWKLFAKLGVSSKHAKISTHASDANGSASTDVRDRRSDVLWGLGAEFMPVKNIGVRLEYENFGKFGVPSDDQDGSARVKADLWSLGLNYRF